jgi:hypothetical protein
VLHWIGGRHLLRLIRDLSLDWWENQKGNGKCCQRGSQRQLVHEGAPPQKQPISRLFAASVTDGNFATSLLLYKDQAARSRNRDRTELLTCVRIGRRDRASQRAAEAFDPNLAGPSLDCVSMSGALKSTSSGAQQTEEAIIRLSW